MAREKSQGPKSLMKNQGGSKMTCVMQGLPVEEPSVYSPVLVLLRKRLEARGFEDEKAFDGGGRWRGMRPIFAALREMDWVGVRIAGGKRGEEVRKLNVGYMDQRQPLRMRLWNLEMGQAQSLSLQETGASTGEYLGEWADLHVEGWWKWRHEVAGKIEAKHLNDAGEAIEWLVEKIAPCVTDAHGLGVVASASHA